MKNAKSLARKCINGRVIDQNAWTEGLLQIRNTPHKATGLSPAILLYGHPVQDRLPAHRKNFERCWYDEVGAYDCKMCEAKLQSERYYNTPTTRDLPAFQVGDEVVIQNIKTKRFDRFGIVKECCDSRRYLIRLPSGMILERNRRFLRPFRKPVDTSKNVVVGTSMHVVDNNVSKSVEPTEPVVFNNNDCVLELEPPENVRMSHNNNFDDQCLRRAPIQSEGIVTVPQQLRRSNRIRRPPDRLNL